MKRYFVLLLLFASVVVVTGVLTVCLQTGAPLIVAIGVALLSAVVLRISNRKTVTAVFVADISGLLEIIKDLDILRTYHRLRDDATSLENEKPLFIDSKEDYFATFASNSTSMGFLRANTAGQITSFYLYLKAARDVRRRLIAWDKGEVDEAKTREYLKYIDNMMRACVVHGLTALEFLGAPGKKMRKLTASFEEQAGTNFITASRDNW